MGLLDGRSNSYSGSTHHRSSSYRGNSPTRSVRSSHSASGNKGQGYYVRPSANRSTSSFFGGDDRNHSSRHDRRSSSRGIFDTGSRGIFGFGGGGGSSYYKRSPRQGYISYLYNKLKRMLRELWYYARRHPMKAFFAVIVPLLSAGGAIHGLMKQFGVKVPGLTGGSRSMGGGYYGSSGYDRRGGSGGGLFGGGGGGGLMDNAGGIMQIAKAFM